MKISIPPDEQIKALSMGLCATYQLLEKYLGDLNYVPNYWDYIDVDRELLTNFLRSNPELAKKHVHISGEQLPHDFPVLEEKSRKYFVSIYSHDELISESFFDDLAEAATFFLLYHKN